MFTRPNINILLGNVWWIIITITVWQEWDNCWRDWAKILLRKRLLLQHSQDDRFSFVTTVNGELKFLQSLWEGFWGALKISQLINSDEKTQYLTHPLIVEPSNQVPQCFLQNKGLQRHSGHWLVKKLGNLRLPIVGSRERPVILLSWKMKNQIRSNVGLAMACIKVQRRKASKALFSWNIKMSVMNTN